jgi:hypothetical protein
MDCSRKEYELRNKNSCTIRRALKRENLKEKMCLRSKRVRAERGKSQSQPHLQKKAPQFEKSLRQLYRLRILPTAVHPEQHKRWRHATGGALGKQLRICAFLYMLLVFTSSSASSALD